MKSREFNAYKRRYGAAIRKVLSEAEPGRLDDIGFPAYSHANPIIHWLFWKRLHIVMDYVERSAPFGRTLDFGCGSGVMLPFLAEMSQEVVATDIDLLPLQHMKRYIPLPPNVREWDASSSASGGAPAASFDLIIALDVLEHVKDLSATLDQLLGWLKPGNQLVVSGPTENALYRFGRKLAGPEYSGEYHERGVAEIRDALAKQRRVKRLATLYWPVPLFEIFTAVA